MHPGSSQKKVYWRNWEQLMKRPKSFDLKFLYEQVISKHKSITIIPSLLQTERNLKQDVSIRRGQCPARLQMRSSFDLWASRKSSPSARISGERKASFYTANLCHSTMLVEMNYAPTRCASYSVQLRIAHHESAGRRLVLDCIRITNGYRGIFVPALVRDPARQLPFLRR